MHKIALDYITLNYTALHYIWLHSIASLVWMWIGQTGNIIASTRAKLPTNCRSKISDWIRAIFFISSMFQFKISWQAICYYSRFADILHISIDYISYKFFARSIAILFKICSVIWNIIAPSLLTSILMIHQSDGQDMSWKCGGKHFSHTALHVTNYLSIIGLHIIIHKM